jgi:hypothetical protein
MCELRWKDFLITLSVIPVISYVLNKCSEPQVERLVSVYHKTDVLGLQTFLRDKFPRWAGNCSCVEEIWKKFKEIVFESIGRFVPHKFQKKKISGFSTLKNRGKTAKGKIQ